MSSFISSDKKEILYREKLLQKHTLEAVFSMPDDLFYPVGVVAGIGVFTAKKPHPATKETYFGYWKDDGHTKKKNLGRVDSGRWVFLKDDYLKNFRNRKATVGQSVTKPRCLQLNDSGNQPRNSPGHHTRKENHGFMAGPWPKLKKTAPILPLFLIKKLFYKQLYNFSKGLEKNNLCYNL